jgi:hypothetical protein
MGRKEITDFFLSEFERFQKFEQEHDSRDELIVVWIVGIATAAIALAIPIHCRGVIGTLGMVGLALSVAFGVEHRIVVRALVVDRMVLRRQQWAGLVGSAKNRDDAEFEEERDQAEIIKDIAAIRNGKAESNEVLEERCAHLGRRSGVLFGGCTRLFVFGGALLFADLVLF